MLVNMMIDLTVYYSSMMIDLTVYNNIIFSYVYLSKNTLI